MMNNIYQIIEGTNYHNTLYSDYKSEIAALNLLKYKAELDQVYLKRLGGNNRTFNKDIENISSQVYELGVLIVSISSFREGMYDYLPENVFHPPSLGNRKSQIKEIIEQIQKQKKIEASARDFFQPFELESFFLLLNAYDKENEFEIIENPKEFLNLLKEFWPLLDTLDNSTSEIFIYMLPFFHTVRGNKEWFEKCLMAFLKIPVKISFTPNYVNDIQEASDAISLSNYQLGISMVLSGEHMNGERNWAIHYGPIPNNDIAKYVQNSELRKLLEVLYEYCLPATVEVEEHFVTEKNDRSFILGESRLGYSTFL
ncbi:MAG TPA: hypothetical protein VFD91_13410 [Mariniphaga sp.]|nr:hypothetical protein [Mariniphaga sp.]